MYFSVYLECLKSYLAYFMYIQCILHIPMYPDGFTSLRIEWDFSDSGAWGLVAPCGCRAAVLWQQGVGSYMDYPKSFRLAGWLDGLMAG
jgi:hypothetical protein